MSASVPVPAHVPDDQLDDLRARLRATRFVPGVSGQPWHRGTDPDFLAELVDRWSTTYDWRAAEARIRALPWQRTSRGIVALHQPAAEPDAPAVVLLHGWPDSVLRFERVLPLLTDVHVVVPCLPGFPFSASLGADQPTMANRLCVAMAEFGHDRYVVSGGDIGAQVAEAWARAHPDHVAALHLTDVPFRHVLALDDAVLTDEERAFRERMLEWQASEGSYAMQQRTKPNTLAVGLGDSPAGLAAWIVEKIRAWSDLSACSRAPVFSRDDLLTWISVYWFTGAIGTSFTPYALRPAPVGARVRVPTVVSAFAAEPLLGPRSLAERIFDLELWDERPSGGHFAAWEQPVAFVDGLRAAIDLAS